MASIICTGSLDMPDGWAEISVQHIRVRWLDAGSTGEIFQASYAAGLFGY
jgi:hypothetical protein